MKNEKLILESLLQMLTFDNINKKHIESYQKAMIEDKAIPAFRPTMYIV